MEFLPFDNPKLMKLVPTEKVLRGAREGSLSCLMELNDRLVLKDAVYREHHAGILDITFQNLDKASRAERPGFYHRVAFITLSSLVAITRWCKQEPVSSPIRVTTALKLFDSCKGYIYLSLWMFTCPLDPGIVPEQEGVHIGAHTVVCALFSMLLEVFPRILPELVKDPNMQAVALLLWIGSKNGKPLMYSGSRRHPDPNVDQTEIAMGIFHQVAMEDMASMVEAIMEERVCPLATFVQATVRRMKFLTRLGSIKRLAYLRHPTIEISNARITVVVTDRLMSANAILYSLFMAHEAPRTYIRILSTLADTALHLKLPSFNNTFEFQLGRIIELTQLASYVVDWPTRTSSSVLNNIKSIMKGGAIKLLGHCYPFLRHDNAQGLDACDKIFKTLRTYALYPQILPLFLREMEWGEIAEGDDEPNPRQALVVDTCNTLEAMLGPFLLSDARQWLCDNLQHKAGSAYPPSRVCSGCQSVAYCSRDCQEMDWNALHRAECPHLARVHLEREASRAGYSFATRSFHANALRLQFDFYETEMMGPNSTTTEVATSGLLTRVHLLALAKGDNDTAAQSTPISDYHDETSYLIPGYLKSRFEAFISTFKQMNEGILDHDSTALEELSDLGSARLTETRICLGDVDVNLILLLRKSRDIKCVYDPVEGRSKVDIMGSLAYLW
ncbi:hypothetical protein D9611_010107 [Ephemerocybe angulata]|uniref:MYND-type domain-containing protein n=1 Tax=Ephemerocybe angulata TaxID=980116 RepID=A0A8H5EV37_9AGAR|nr:hypothetical protein D9611_010107 [Tulosesus angulatus]